MTYEILAGILGGLFLAGVVWRLVVLELRVNALLHLVDRLLDDQPSEIDVAPFECPRCKQPTPIPGVICPRCRERI
jgi:hypothetical protein